MIVIIEDDNIFVKNVISKLNKLWIKEIKVFNSIQSYIHIEANLYLIDIKLEQNSFDLIKEIREKTNAPICIVSSYSEKDCVKLCFKHWADMYINKIINPYLYSEKVLWMYNMSKRLYSLQKNNKWYNTH